MNDFASAVKDDQAFPHAFSELHAHMDIQFTFLQFTPPKTPDWLLAVMTFLSRNGVAIKWGLAAIALLIAAGLLLALARRYWPWIWKKSITPIEARNVVGTDWRPTPSTARRLLQECDVLAAEGRYSEAVHLLLLRSIEDIEEHRPRVVRPSLTSREIGTLDALPASARPAFADIARTVERARFAEQPIDVAEFTRCRQTYESFAVSPVWQAGGGN